MVNHSKVGMGISFSNLKILDYGLKRYAERASSASWYQLAIFELNFSNPNSKCLLGCAQTPFILHRTDAGCAFAPQTLL